MKFDQYGNRIPSYPNEQRITKYKSGDRVVDRNMGSGTVRACSELSPEKLARVILVNLFGKAPPSDYLVVELDNPGKYGTLVSFSWDGALEPEAVEAPRKEVFYVAHPVSGDIEKNLANVIGWINWLTHNDQSRVYIAPWVAEVMAFKDDPLVVQDNQATKDFYDRVLADDVEVVKRLDGILLVGGTVSRGMAIERDKGGIGKTIQDWSYARTPADLLPEHIAALGCQ